MKDKDKEKVIITLNGKSIEKLNDIERNLLYRKVAELANTNAEMKSKEELDELKRDWCSDPCWDI